MNKPSKALRVLLVDESPHRAGAVEQALRQAGHAVAAHIAPHDDLRARVDEIRPDVIIIDMESPDRDTLEHMCCIGRDLPLVMFTHDGDKEKIHLAMHAGVSAYIVNGLSSERIKPIIDVAIARFQEFQALRGELTKATTALEERKLIERAKGMVMKQRQCSEDEAYQALRKLAMTRNLRMTEVARTVITAAELLM
ncbi:MAG: ANTAR domain-containing protein [Gammaproteobacteria bacterium]|nr:ANTAR domain-containing protein [Gammaproteobacteria bacterium]